MPATQRLVRVLLSGDERHHEFREAAQWLADHTNLAGTRDIDTTIADLQAGAVAPEVVVVLQARPGSFPHAKIERLRRAAPLSRLVVLLGSWCEGETLSGRPLPGVVRVFWHQWRPRFAIALRCIADGTASAWDLPQTSSQADRHLSYQPTGAGSGNGMIAIHARHLITFESLSDACRGAGYGTVWLAPGQPWYAHGADVVLCDLTHFDELQQQQLHELVQQVQPSPVLALLGFPRWEDREKALAAGAVEVLSKPLLNDELVWHLERARQATARPGRSNSAA